MAVLRRIKIGKFRNVVPGTEFELHPRLNVLLGKNGTGKTTLLQWLADVLSDNTDAWADEAYEVELEFESDSICATFKLQNTIEQPDRVFPIPGALEGTNIGSSRPPKSGQLTVELRLTTPEHAYEVHSTSRETSVQRDGQDLSRMPGGTIRGWHLVKRIIDCEGDLARRTMLMPLLGALRAASTLCRFDEALRFFQSIVADKGQDDRARIVFQFDWEFNVFWRSPQLIPEDLAIALDRVFHLDHKARTLEVTGKDFAVLETAATVFDHRAISLRAELLDSGAFGASGGGSADFFEFGRLSFIIERRDGSVFRHDRLSFGQKRMLAFLYYLALCPRLIIVDELVNGLHHEWIRRCMEEIGDRQGLLTSQNPLLLDYLTFDSADEMRRRFILCRSRQKEDGSEELVWRNPTPEEAESFYKAYQVAIQHVGEILIDKGLW